MPSRRPPHHFGTAKHGKKARCKNVGRPERETLQRHRFDMDWSTDFSFVLSPTRGKQRKTGVRIVLVRLWIWDFPTFTKPALKKSELCKSNWHCESRKNLAVSTCRPTATRAELTKRRSKMLKVVLEPKKKRPSLVTYAATSTRCALDAMFQQNAAEANCFSTP